MAAFSGGREKGSPLRLFQPRRAMRYDRVMIVPPPRPDSSHLAQLGERSREIFRAVVDSYLASGEPVGSRQLSRLLPMTLSPASVRNVMQDLEELGLVYAPHISAGRLPTEIGLRFFVDSLLQMGDVEQDERAAIEAQVTAASRDHDLEGVLSEATSLLSGLTRVAGVVVVGKSDARLKQIDFVRLEPERVLAILVAEDGSVENRVLPVSRDLPASALIEAANYLNARITGRTLEGARAEIDASRRAAQAELDTLTQRLVEAGLASWGGGAGRQADRARTGAAAGGFDRARRSGARAAAVLRSGDQDRGHRPAGARRGRRGRADFHRLGEQAVLALGLLANRRPAARRQ